MKKISIKCMLIFLLMLILHTILSATLCSDCPCSAKYTSLKVVNGYLNTTGVVLKDNLYDTLKENELPIYLDNLDKVKLIKRGKKCFIYGGNISIIFSEREYKKYYLHTIGNIRFGFKGNYKNGEKCKFGDYKNCNVYFTEKGVLEHKNKYDCK